MRPEAIRCAMAEHFGGQHANFYCDLLGPCFRTNNGVVYCSECSLYSGRVAIKWVHNAAALAQYDALVEAEKKLGSAGEFAVPHPVSKLENEQIIVMEWIDGESLSRLLSRDFLTPAKSLSYANRAGRWLHRFHNMENLPLSRLPVTQRVNSLRADVAAARLGDDIFTQTALRLLEETMHFSGSYLLPQGVIHGDFTPDNILLSEGRTVGIDFGMRRRNVVILDLANFIAHLLLLAWEPAAVLHGLHRRRYSLVASFLDGYQAEGSEIPSVPIAWLRLQILLQIYPAPRPVRVR